MTSHYESFGDDGTVVAAVAIPGGYAAMVLPDGPLSAATRIQKVYASPTTALAAARKAAS